jgi:hypothetical protein
MRALHGVHRASVRRALLAELGLQVGDASAQIAKRLRVLGLDFVSNPQRLARAPSLPRTLTFPPLLRLQLSLRVLLTPRLSLPLCFVFSISPPRCMLPPFSPQLLLCPSRDSSVGRLRVVVACVGVERVGVGRVTLCLGL